MLPALEPYTLVLLIAGERAADPADDETLDRLQEAHVSYLLGLIEEGQIAACGPFADQPDRTLRGMAIFRTSVEEASALMQRDPVVQTGRLTFQAMTWWVEKGRLPALLPKP